MREAKAMTFEQGMYFATFIDLEAMSYSSAELELNGRQDKRMDPRVPDLGKGYQLNASYNLRRQPDSEAIVEQCQHQLRDITLYLLVLFLCDGRTRV